MCYLKCSHYVKVSPSIMQGCVVAAMMKAVDPVSVQLRSKHKLTRRRYQAKV